MDVGVVVNPIAGMGGRVGLKGTDGKLEEARERGAEPRAPARAREALESLARHAPECTLYTVAGMMGEDVARAAGFDPQIITTGDGATDTAPMDEDGAELETSAEDTQNAVRAFLEQGVDLVLFVGGDGTAVDVADVLETLEGAETGIDDSDRTPMLGVPAGVKIYSSVFAVTPADAGRVAAEFERVEFREVNDIDEDAYREGTVRSELRAIVPVPVAPALQSSKQLASGSVDSLAAGFAREIESDRIYIFGPGSTVGAIETELEIDPSPLGIDVWYDGDLLARDAAEADILEALAERDADVTIVVSPIGGQGFIFGRGNHQLSPAVLEHADEIEVVASEAKLDGIDALHVDTDDKSIDEDLCGWIRVRTGRFTTRLIQVV
ncbi:ATP-NAD kinase family protein [Natronolimnobius sp. AArcel1]|uniref:ATP-NAD kinase family protein n=1 Tax=Natronolimnobius sp. AArcel1 TaxID=1679093 RepID=UPI0013EA04ED|nr:ATP-NAD kinase family protein [Natronolimnobius sp. AArcel1]NGM67605.1 ATP-NAD kinase family protein [Natronolimnobius sp. AArcel1]